MSIAQSILREFEEQAPVTRKFLERLPEDRLTWKPHERSLSAGQLAFHLAFVPGGVVRRAQKSPAQATDFNFPQPASREEIILGKILTVTTASFMTALLTIASLLVAMQRLGLGRGGAELEQLVSRAAPDAGTVALVLLTLVPTALFAASVMIAIALFARGFKEAQSLLTPVVMAVVVPAVISLLPGSVCVGS